MASSKTESAENSQDRKIRKFQEKKRLFSESEVLDIEELQDMNVFGDLKDQLEENYIQLENLIKHQEKQDNDSQSTPFN